MVGDCGGLPFPSRQVKKRGMFEVATHLALILILAAFVAGVVDSIAGGGGLVTVPVFLLAGASPVEALRRTNCRGPSGRGRRR